MPIFRHALVLGLLPACLSPGMALAYPTAPRTLTISGQGEGAGVTIVWEIH